MSTPIKIIPPSDSDESKKAVGPAQEDSSKSKTTAPNTDDGSRKPFKEVLEATMADKRPIPKPVKVTPAKSDDDDDDTVTLLDLAAKASVRECAPKPSITQTAVFRQEVEAEVVAEVDEDAPKKTPAAVIQEKPEEKPHVAIASKVVVEREKLPEKEQPVVRSVEKEKDDKPVRRASEDISPKIAFHEVKNPQVDPKTVIGLAAPQQVVAPPPAAVQAHLEVPNARQAMMQLAQAMVEKIQLIQAPGRTDTTLQLKYPPLFEGVKIHISEYETSQKQLNITFSDLTNPTARALIEQKDNQLQLQQQLIDRGYTLQTITIEQKIPGLSSTETGDVTLRQQGQSEGQAGSATDQEDKR